VTIEAKSEAPRHLNAKKDYPELEKIPMVVLINEGSASASEIFAGCMKDYKRARIVGEKSFGKGLVQQPFPLHDGSYIKLTIARYLTPNGNVINRDEGKSIEPDIEIKQTTEEYGKIFKYWGQESLKNSELKPPPDKQLDKALELLRGK
jgi:carboxyl-terminal processing protease